MYDARELARNAPGMGIKDDAPMVDMAALRVYRLSRLQDEVQARDCAALLLLDPINIRYAAGIKAGADLRDALPEPLRGGAGRRPGHGARLGDRKGCLAAGDHRPGIADAADYLHGGRDWTG